jgi:hypothetical protein
MWVAKEARWRARPPRLSDTVNESDTGDEANGDNNLGASLFYFRRSNEEFGDCGVGNISSESYMPEYRQMKAKRLLLLDEVGYIYVPRLSSLSLSRARAHKHSFIYIYIYIYIYMMVPSSSIFLFPIVTCIKRRMAQACWNHFVLTILVTSLEMV